MDKQSLDRLAELFAAKPIRIYYQFRSKEPGYGVAMYVTPMKLLVRLYLAGYDVKPQIISAFFSADAGDAWDRMAKFDWRIK